MTITTEDSLPDNVQAKLVTALNSNQGDAWAEVPFVRADNRTLVCRIVPERPGLHSFRAGFSPDKGATWLRDMVTDAWMLIDASQVDGLRVYTVIPTVSDTVADWKADLKRIREMANSLRTRVP